MEKIRIEDIRIERLTEENFNPHSLDNFIRHQVVSACWRKVDGQWKILPIAFVEDWDLDKCREEASAIAGNLHGDLIDFGAFHGTDLLGYITVGTEKIGTEKQYVQLVTFEVSEPFRGMGIGRKLFEKAAETARSYGAEKLYISGHSSIESQAAYKALGCEHAAEIIPWIAEEEPYDVQLEYRLKRELSIAFLQLLPEETLEKNLEKGIRACREAKERGADIALFPEMWSTGYHMPRDPKALKERAVSEESSFIKSFSALAAELNMAIAVTFLEEHEPKPRNSVCLFDRHGLLVYKYAKVHICDFGLSDDEGVLDAGDCFITKELDTEKGIIQVGSMICYDREFPESARILMLQGAELLLVPNACPMELNRLAQLRGRAYENMVAIATCNYPSPHPDCNGHSTLFDGVVYVPYLPGSRDTCVFEAGEEEGIYIAKLDVDQLRDYRRREVWGNKHRRPELYGALSKT